MSNKKLDSKIDEELYQNVLKHIESLVEEYKNNGVISLFSAFCKGGKEVNLAYFGGFDEDTFSFMVGLRERLDEMISEVDEGIKSKNEKQKEIKLPKGTAVKNIH